MHPRCGRCGKRRPHIHRVSHTSHSDRRYHFNEELPTDSAREAQSEKVVAALRDGFLSTADSGASLVVHVLHKDVFDRLRGNRTNLKGIL